jgi:pyridoxal phosphate enzyme (YggS family)
MDNSLEIVERIEGNYKDILNRIENTAKKCGVDPSCIRLIVVTKAKPLNIVRAVINAGIQILGENYAEEGVSKINQVAEQVDVKWHMIGHVQSRKARLIIEYYDYLHSLDSLKLANRLNRFAEDFGKTLPVLLQCNVSGEHSKHGFVASDEGEWAKLLPIINEILTLNNLSVRGLMTIPPFFENAEESRPYYKKLRMLTEFLQRNFTPCEWTELSMGMSHDFEVAIEEGATWVRVGQAILGPRV